MSGQYDIPDDEVSFGNLGGSQELPAPVAPPAAPSPTPPQAQEPASTGDAPLPPLPKREKRSLGPSLGGAATPPAVGGKRKFKAPPRRDTPRAMGSSNMSPRHQVEAWLAAMVESNASDLILRAGGRPSLRVDGGIQFLPGRVPGPGPLLEVLQGVMGKDRMGQWADDGSADAAIQLDGLGRFRLNAYKQMGEPAVVIRRIAEDAPSLEDLDLPADLLGTLAMRKRGLVLVTGIAGSGKSTTLAAMIRHMNDRIERHVITLEDPVELLHKENMCVISQREVGTDTSSFQDGLRHALRQSPDVILIGEVRDAATVVAALEATETGHLVISTMHTVNAAQTVDRILGFFPAERHAQIRQRMADNLAGVLSQRLVVRSSKKGLVPAFELMTTTPHIRELLEEGKTTEMARAIEGGSEAGLISFNECLRGLVERNTVELEDALATSDRPEELLLAMRGIRGSSERVQSPSQEPGAVGQQQQPQQQQPQAPQGAASRAPKVPGQPANQTPHGGQVGGGIPQHPSNPGQNPPLQPPGPADGQELRLSPKKDRRE